MIMKQTSCHLLLAFCICFSALQAIENSIIPEIEFYETVENLNPKKFSSHQFKDITSVLDHKEEKIRLLSYNILFALYDHNLDYENRWPQRLPRIAELIDEMQPDIIGVQELYDPQSQELQAYLNDVYAFYSKPCVDGELNGIFYRKDRFEVIESHVWYMSETPQIPDADTLTLLKLKDVKTGKTVALFNTHLAFSKIDKREAEARFIAEYTKKYTGTPTVLMGDLNTFPARLDMKRLPFYDGDYIHRILTSGALKDAKEVSLLGHLGPIATFTNENEDPIPFKGRGTPGVFLDHIYVSPGINVIIHAVQPGTVDGHFPSDHLPILIDFILK